MLRRCNAGESRSVSCVALRALQFRAGASDVALYARDGRWREQSAMVGRGFIGERWFNTHHPASARDFAFLIVGMVIFTYGVLRWKTSRPTAIVFMLSGALNVLIAFSK